MGTEFLKSNMSPFSNEEVYLDSSMFKGEIVEHTTSWLSINPFKGCSLKCAYCFRVKWGAEDKPQPTIDLETAIDELIIHPDFIPHITPISINISSTDALLPSVKESTFGALRILESKELRNPFGITSKLGLLRKEIDFLASLQFIRPILFISLAFIPKNIEPVPIKPRLRNLQMLSETNIPTVVYFRPIVEGWNDTDEIIEKILQIANKYATSICIGSLRTSAEIRRELDVAGVNIDDFPDEFHLKHLHGKLEERIMEKYRDLKIDIPLFKHTSCAVSNIIRISNYNLLYKNPKRNCSTSCPSTQQKLCNSKLLLNE